MLASDLRLHALVKSQFVLAKVDYVPPGGYLGDHAHPEVSLLIELGTPRPLRDQCRMSTLAAQIALPLARVAPATIPPNRREEANEPIDQAAPNAVHSTATPRAADLRSITPVTHWNPQTAVYAFWVAAPDSGVQKKALQDERDDLRRRPTELHQARLTFAI